jgi:hypothetical protein
MNVREEIEGLVAFEGRGPGTDAERRAAGHLAERLQELGREGELDSVDVWPNWPLTYAIHVAMAIVGSVVSVTVPLVGALLVLIAVALTFLDAIGMAFTTRRLLGRRASQNVISRESDEDKGGDLFLVAHYDAGRGGLAFHPTLQERRATIGKLLRRNIGPLHPLFGALVWVLVCVLLRLPGIESQILTVLQFIPTVLLILALPFLLDTALASPVPGANDNASGVATVLRLAERFGGQLEHFNVNLLLTGSQEAMALGMRGYLKKRKGELDDARTVFVSVDEIGRGTVRFTSREGLLLAIESHPQLLDICEQIVEDQQGDDDGDQDGDDSGDENGDDDGDENGDDDGRPAVRSMEALTSSDAYAARSAGFPAITITCKGRLDYTPGHHQRTDTPDRIDDEAMERAYAFTAELIERLDQTVGPDLHKPQAETLLKEES